MKRGADCPLKCCKKLIKKWYYECTYVNVSGCSRGLPPVPKIEHPPPLPKDPPRTDKIPPRIRTSRPPSNSKSSLITRLDTFFPFPNYILYTFQHLLEHDTFSSYHQHTNARHIT